MDIRHTYSQKSSLSMGRQDSMESLDFNAAPRVGGMSTAQIVVVSSLFCFLFWVLGCQVLLLLLAFQFRGVVVDTARERYTIAGAERVGAVAGKVLATAMSAKNALDYAIQRQLYFEPLDYDAIRMALEPAFYAMPTLRAVDIGFNTRNESVSVRRQIAQDENKPLLVQSSGANCNEKLGRYGCLSAKRARDTAWFKLGMALAGGQEVDNTTDPSVTGAFRWDPEPGFVPAYTGALIENEQQVDWSPAYALISRSVFPGTYGKLSAIARFVVAVEQLGAKQHLVDTERLGKTGSIFICDSAGKVLASVPPGSIARLDGPDVSVNFRNAWELPTPWAGELSKDQFSSNQKSWKTPEDFHVVISPLLSPGLQHFRVLMAAARDPFVDPSMAQSTNIGEVLVWLPFGAVICIGAIYWIMSKVKERRKMSRVHAKPEEKPPPLPGGSPTHSPDSGMAMLRLKQ